MNQTIPGLPDGFGESLTDRLFDCVAHGQAQAIIMASMNLVPHLDRTSFIESTTIADLVAWLGPELPVTGASRGSRVQRPRGSYATAAATLRPIIDSDLQQSYLASLDPRNAHRWRFRGQTPSPDDFRRSFFAPGVLAQFAVVPTEAESNAALGIVSAYDADLTNGYASVAFQRFESATPDASRDRGLMIDGFLVFIQYLFDHFNFRKIYLEIPEYNLCLFEGGARDILVEEGRLKDHLYYGDRYWDQCIHALYRARWEEVADPFRGAWQGR